MSKRALIVDTPRHKRPIIRSLALLGIMFYLGFHAVSGERGVFALFKETRQLHELETELTRVKGERQGLEHKVQLMSSDSLDLDLLDEQVRRVLGLANKGEIIYLPDEDTTLDNS